MYKYQTPALREAQSEADYVDGKELHRYSDVREHRVVAIRDERAWVRLAVTWTPRHPELQGADPDQLTQTLDLVDAWRWTGSEWCWHGAGRTGDFLAEHPELEEELEGR